MRRVPGPLSSRDLTLSLVNVYFSFLLTRESKEFLVTGRRVHERFECDLPVTLLHDDQEFEAVATNISLGGVYLVTEATMPYGSLVNVRFRVPAMKKDATVAGTIRWVKPDGVGVQFGSLRALEVWALNQYFKGLKVSPETSPTS